MSIKGFLRALFRGTPEDEHPMHNPGDDLADTIREGMGPQASGGLGGRMTGHSVYELLEDDSDDD